MGIRDAENSICKLSHCAFQPYRFLTLSFWVNSLCLSWNILMIIQFIILLFIIFPFIFPEVDYKKNYALISILKLNFFEMSYFAGWHNSTKTPCVPFGCKKQISLLSAPNFGFSFSAINPSFFKRSISATISSTANAM